MDITLCKNLVSPIKAPCGVVEAGSRLIFKNCADLDIHSSKIFPVSTFNTIIDSAFDRYQDAAGVLGIEHMEDEVFLNDMSSLSSLDDELFLRGR